MASSAIIEYLNIINDSLFCLVAIIITCSPYTSSFFKIPKKLSDTALSQQFPFLLILDRACSEFCVRAISFFNFIMQTFSYISVSFILSSRLQDRCTGHQPRKRLCYKLYFTNSISLILQDLSRKGLSGPYILNATNQLLPGIVCNQLFS